MEDWRKASAKEEALAHRPQIFRSLVSRLRFRYGYLFMQNNAEPLDVVHDFTHFNMNVYSTDECISEDDR